MVRYTQYKEISCQKKFKSFINRPTLFFSRKFVRLGRSSLWEEARQLFKQQKFAHTTEFWTLKQGKNSAVNPTENYENFFDPKFRSRTSNKPLKICLENFWKIRLIRLVVSHAYTPYRQKAPHGVSKNGSAVKIDKSDKTVYKNENLLRQWFDTLNTKKSVTKKMSNPLSIHHTLFFLKNLCD